MIQRLPAWGTTLGKRITAYPKVHVIDSASFSQSSARPSRSATAVAACRTTSEGMKTASRSLVALVAS